MCLLILIRYQLIYNRRCKKRGRKEGASCIQVEWFDLQILHPSTMKLTKSLILLLLFTLLIVSNSTFQSDELLVDDEEFGLEGGRTPDLDITASSPPVVSLPHSPPQPIRKRSADSESDSRVQFALEHAFEDSDEFSAAGTFTARIKTSAHGGQVWWFFCWWWICMEC